MKRREESSTNSIRGGWSARQIDSVSRPGMTVLASDKQPALNDRGNSVERVIQQAILQILTPVFDPNFSDSSHGFRPNRSAHGAMQQVQRSIKSGGKFVVDMDLSKFFDRVNHDVLMNRIARRVPDKLLLKLIGRYLRAGVIVDGELQSSECRAGSHRPKIHPRHKRPVGMFRVGTWVTVVPGHG